MCVHVCECIHVTMCACVCECVHASVCETSERPRVHRTESFNCTRNNNALPSRTPNSFNHSPSRLSVMAL